MLPCSVQLTWLQSFAQFTWLLCHHLLLAFSSDITECRSHGRDYWSRCQAHAKESRGNQVCKTIWYIFSASETNRCKTFWLFCAGNMIEALVCQESLILRKIHHMPDVVSCRLGTVWQHGFRFLQEAAYTETRCLLVFVAVSYLDLDEHLPSTAQQAEPFLGWLAMTCPPLSLTDTVKVRPMPYVLMP